MTSLSAETCDPNCPYCKTDDFVVLRNLRQNLWECVKCGAIFDSFGDEWELAEEVMKNKHGTFPNGSVLTRGESGDSDSTDSNADSVLPEPALGTLRPSAEDI